MAICTLILCHQADDYVADLFRSIHDDDGIVLIHADAKAPDQLKTLVGAIGATFANAHVVPSRMCSWGGYSLTAATLDAMRLALALPSPWSHFVVLSEQHLPLLSMAELRSRLEPDVSYLEANLVSKKYPAGQADVMHRFARCYRELPGVGSFARHPQTLRDDWLSQLHHGSQWIVLSRSACAAVLQNAQNGDFWEPFACSLLSDETAIPTSVMTGVNAGTLTMKSWSASFIATPAAGGLPGLVFTEDNYRQACSAGKWFIRKRPEVLPESVRADIERFALYSDAAFRDRLGLDQVDATATAPGPDHPLVREPLMHALREMLPAIEIGEETGKVHCPDCYLTFRLPGWLADLLVCLLSSDFVHFKVMVVCREKFDGSYKEIMRGGYALSVIKARVYGLAFFRELIVGDALDYGFLTVRSFEDAPKLAWLVGQHIAVADAYLTQAASLADEVPSAALV